MVSRRTALGLLLGTPLAAQTTILPLRDLRPGTIATGRTVFQGDRIEEFRVEILGVLENAGPRQSIILGRLSGPTIERTGVMQGMSGSPVYVDGKLLGAVAMAFPFSKEPIAGIRPIEEMLRAALGPSVTTPRPPSLQALRLDEALPARASVRVGDSQLVPIATPVSFGGFTVGTLTQFAPQLRTLGLEPRQGMNGGGAPRTSSSDPSRLQPGSMISVQLMSGDFSVGADGTVTHVEGNRVYGFGHPFLSVGDTEFPFARAEVIALLPNVSTSFKISTAREWMGTILEDRSAAIAGEIGRRATTIPLALDVTGRGLPPSQYRIEVVHHRLLTPFLVQMAVYSALDTTQRTLGAGTIRLRGEVNFADNTPPLQLDNAFASDFNAPIQAATAAAIPLSYVLQSGFDSLKVRDIRLSLAADTRERVYQIDQVYASRRQVRPGDAVQVTAVFLGVDGHEESRTVPFTVPVGAPLGPLNITVADAVSSNVADYFQLTAPPRSKAQAVAQANALRPNQRAYVRVWRANPGFQVPGATLSDPPTSLALILGRTQAGLGNAIAARNAKLVEVPIDLGDAVVSGGRTIQVDVKE